MLWRRVSCHCILISWLQQQHPVAVCFCRCLLICVRVVLSLCFSLCACVWSGGSDRSAHLVAFSGTLLLRASRVTSHHGEVASCNPLGACRFIAEDCIFTHLRGVKDTRSFSFASVSFSLTLSLSLFLSQNSLFLFWYSSGAVMMYSHDSAPELVSAMILAY